ncbi:MAG: MBL fold metallo-hydrolase [Treponemataceae bacterium]
MRFTILGSGTSHGVPVIACSCDVCLSKDKKDKRLRSSALIEHDETTILIDIGPDFRQQALTYGLKNLDAILLTHSHADHVHGLDDMRIFSVERPLPIYANNQTISDVKNRFDYVFKNTQIGGGKPHLDLISCEQYTAEKPLCIKNIQIVPIPLQHGCIPCTGWRIGKIAYLTDLHALPESSFMLLEGIDILVIDALRKRDHTTHCSFSSALEIAAKTTAQQIYFTHICHDFSHNQICELIKQEREQSPCLRDKIIAPSYDGLFFDIL